MLITPNWHVAVVHFPVALLSIGLAGEVLGAFLRSASLRSAGRWMLLIGAFAGLPVALSGYYALFDLARQGATGANWHELAATSPFTPPQWDALTGHARSQSISAVVALLATAFFLAASDGIRRTFYLAFLLLFAFAAAGTLFGAHLGGDAVYRHATGVKAVLDPEPSTRPIQSWIDASDRAAAIVPPIEFHAIMAGSAISAGLLAIAAALRNTTKVDTGRTPIAVGNHPPPVNVPLLPASRLLLLAACLTLLASLSGIWFLAHDSETFSPAELWQTILPFPWRNIGKPENALFLRRPAHVILGSLLVLIPLLLALTHKWWPRSRFLPSLLAMTYLAAAAGQLPLGLLMLYDQPTGPLASLTAPTTQP